MPPRRRTDPAAGLDAVRRWHAAPAEADRDTVSTAVRWTLQVLAERTPGNSVEVRVPPFGVVQCVAGPRHTRGTPPNVIETDAPTWLALAVGDLTWARAQETGSVSASGARAELARWLPLVDDGALGTVGP